VAKWQPGQSGNPNGRAAGPKTVYRREIRAATARMGAGLLDVTDALMDLARGHHILLIRTDVGWAKAETREQFDAALAVGAEAYRVYREAPNLGAIQTVWERVGGRVPQPVDVEVRQLIVHITEDHAALARILQEYVPAEYLEPVLAELERVEGRRRAAAGLLAGGVDP
jgi:hypothetical protein